MNEVELGTMLMSIPAASAMRTAASREGATRCTVCSRTMSSQSLTTTPRNPSSVRNRSVSSARLACTGTPFTSPEFTITVAMPASIAARKVGRKYSRSCRSGIQAVVRSFPLSGML
jgi:hypothetical protein